MKTKYKLILFLFFCVQIAFSQFRSSSAGYYNYVNPNQGHEVQIEIPFKIAKSTFDDITISTTFKAAPVSTLPIYYFDNERFVLNQLGEFGSRINYNKIRFVTATIEFTIGTGSYTTRINGIPTNGKYHSIRFNCSDFGIDDKNCGKIVEESMITATIKRIEVNTTDDTIEDNIRKYILKRKNKAKAEEIRKMPENTLDDLIKKNNAYYNLSLLNTNKYQKERDDLDDKIKVKKLANKGKEISKAPENTIAEIDQKIQKYRDLANEDGGNSYQTEISNLLTKKNNIKPKEENKNSSNNSSILNKSSNNNIVKNNSNFSNNTSKKSYPISKQTTTVGENKSNIAETHFTSAEQNFSNGNYDQAIIDLESAKKHTSDPKIRAVIESNLKSARSIKTFQQNYAATNAHIKRENYLNQQSADFVAKVDAASNGNHLLAASQKFGYALGNALGGRIDVNSIAGTAVSVINFLGEKKREKEALEAQKRAIKKKIEEENRKRELARIKYVNGLKRERNLVYRDLPEYTYPNYLTESDKTSYYYFVIYTNDNILTKDYPNADITDIIEVKKYKDGTWPFENDFKRDIQKLSSKPISKIIGYTNYEIATQKLASMIKGFGKGGVNLQFIKANKNKISEDTKYTATNKQDPKDFWGKKISLNKNTKILKKTTKTSKTTTQKDFWGKSIQVKKQKDTLVKKKTTKKKEFWGKPIKIKN